MLEIQKARDDARAAVGAQFDLATFLDCVFEDGGVSLTVLTAKIHRWASGSQ
jgi:uncharacterized protein (DUF885 family)